MKSRNSSRRLLAALPAVLIVVALPLFMPWLGVGAGYCMGYYPGVMEPLRKCREARLLLGEDIGPAYLGLSCGQAMTEGGYGRATWSMPVSGERERGTYRFYLERHGGGWNMLRAQLEAGGETVNILSCRVRR